VIHPPDAPVTAAPSSASDTGASDTAADTGAADTGAADTGASVHPRVWQRRVAVLRDQGRHRLRWVVAVVVALAAVCVAVLVLHTPLVAVRHTTVRGVAPAQVGAVLEAAGLAGDPPMIDVDPVSAAAQVEALPWVARAAVVRRWPDSVSVTVTERVPLAAVPRPGGGAAVVDASGHVLAWEPSLPGGLLLSGPVPPGPPGSVLAAADRPVVTVGAALPAPMAGRVRQVSVNRAGVVALDLGGHVGAVLGPVTDLGRKLAALTTVLEEVRPTGPAVIDVTVPDQPTVGPPPAP